MGKLFVIPTPIGNLRDITLRAIDTLKEVDLILAEDTRVTAKLLSHLEISKPLRAFHMHNEHRVVEGIIEELSQGKTIGLVSDAGTPGISDPGFLLVRACVKANIKVETLPGATAFVPALVNSGLPCDKFIFEGFIPVKKGRQTKFKQIAEHTITTVLYESPYRVVKTIEQLAEILGEDREASYSREISKLHEETYSDTLGGLASHLKMKEKIKGEFVIIIKGKS